MVEIGDKIKSMEDEVMDLTPTFIIYGSEGVGKTTLASGAPNPLLIDVEGGRGSIMKTENEPDILEPDTVDGLGDAYVWLKDNEDEYDSVILDTITEIEKWFLMEIVETGAKKNSSKNPDLITQNDYLQGSTRLRKMGRKFRNLDMNTIFLAHQREDKDEMTGVIKYGPAVMPSVMKDLNAFCDYIFYLGVDEDGIRNLLTQPTERYTAKHRVGELPKKIELGDSYEDMDFQEILTTIKDSNKEESE